MRFCAVILCRAEEEAAEDAGSLGSALGEQGAAKAATQLVIDLTERLHEAEAQVELLRGRLQTRRLSKVLRCRAELRRRLAQQLLNLCGYSKHVIFSGD